MVDERVNICPDTQSSTAGVFFDVTMQIKPLESEKRLEESHQLLKEYEKDVQNLCKMLAEKKLGMSVMIACILREQ